MHKIVIFIKNKKIIRWLLLLGVIVGVYIVAKRDSLNTIPVKAVNIEKNIVLKTISTTGEVTSLSKAELSFNTLGTIKKINVTEGAKVSRNDLLVQLDSEALYNSLQATRDSRDIALRDKEYFVEKYQYNKSGAGGKDEYEITLRKYNELISQAEAMLALKQTQVSDIYLYSPIEGIVYDITKNEGELASVGEVIVKVADLNQLVFEIELDQEDYGLVKKDQKVEIELDSYPNKKLTGKVYELPLYANGGGTGTFKVKMIFDPSAEVTPLLGMTGDVHIITSSTNEAVDTLYYDQVFIDENDKYYIWIVDNNVIKKFPVTVGLEGDVYFEIKSKVDKPIVIGQNSDVIVKDGFKAKFAK